MLLILSAGTVQSGWVDEQLKAARQHQEQYPDFRVIPLKIEDFPIPDSLEIPKSIDCVDGNLNLEIANQLLLSFYYSDIHTLNNAKDIFVSRSWRTLPESEAELADVVCQILDKNGFRLIGDKEDQKTHDESRIKPIIRSCGGLVAILPDRGNGQTSKYMLREVIWALEADLPILIIADETVLLTAELADKTIRINPEWIKKPALISQAILPSVWDLADEWVQPLEPHYAFYGTNLDHPTRTNTLQKLVEVVTAMPCKIGENIREKNIQETICNQIQNAFFMIADISTENLNTCIEAGMARGAKIPLHLIAQAPRRSPPFMFRDMQVEYFEDDIELLSHIHRIAYPYRRRVMNYELTAST